MGRMLSSTSMLSYLARLVRCSSGRGVQGARGEGWERYHTQLFLPSVNFSAALIQPPCGDDRTNGTHPQRPTHNDPHKRPTCR